MAETPPSPSAETPKSPESWLSRLGSSFSKALEKAIVTKETREAVEAVGLGELVLDVPYDEEEDWRRYLPSENDEVSRGEGETPYIPPATPEKPKSEPKPEPPLSFEQPDI